MRGQVLSRSVRERPRASRVTRWKCRESRGTSGSVRERPRRRRRSYERSLLGAREARAREQQRVGAVLDVVERGELLLAVPAAAPRGDEDHAGGEDVGQGRAVWAGARQEA